jgi:aminoglycoside phosphotransferase family enzyme
MLTRGEVLAKLETLVADKEANAKEWDTLVEEEDAAYEEFEDRFGSRRKALEAQDEQIEFLDKVQVIDGIPIFIDEQEFTTAFRTIDHTRDSRLWAMFNAGRGHTTMAVVEGEQAYRYFRLDHEDLEAARQAATAWVTHATLPDWHELSNRELTAGGREDLDVTTQILSEPDSIPAASL